jgi:hypothetical protein
MVALMGGPNFAMGGPTMGVPSTGIIISKGAISPVGDPSLAYTFDIQLAAGSILLNDGYITVYDLLDITSTSLHSEPNDFPNFFWIGKIQELGTSPANATLPFTDSATIENITWRYMGPTIDNSSGTSAVDLGEFSVGPIPENTPTQTLNYLGSLDGTTEADTGSITVTAIPEPSSLILLFTAMVGAPLLVLRTRQRRRVAV